jgi:HemY protein
MAKFLLIVVVLFAAALGLHALSQVAGEASLTIDGTVYAVNLTIAVLGAVAVVLVALGLIWFLRAIVRSPWRIARGWRRRSRERGRVAISEGLVAIAAGDVRAAERAMQEASKRAPGQPLTRLLQAQTAQLKGDRVAAREVFKDMVEDRATRIAGLRGLYIEADREGEEEAAHQIAERARLEAPTAPWATRALLRHQTAAADWDGALATLSSAADGRILDKRTARRQRAVILTAKALAKEDGEPDVARQAAQEAHDLAPDLVPAAVVAGRLFARQGDIRRATKILEAAWKANPHPEIADAYTRVRAGDSAIDRVKRAESLFRMRSLADEGRHAVARSAIDARDFARAREVLIPILTERPTQKALILMAELDEAETGDRGRAREWLARAVRAPRDPAWTADGIVLEEWAPVSPVSGKLDAVEWKLPVAEIEGPRITIDKAELAALPAPPGGGNNDIERKPEGEAKPAAVPAQSAESAGAKPHAPDPRVVLMTKVNRGDPSRPVPVVDPPQPDDPGTADPSDGSDELRSSAR